MRIETPLLDRLRGPFAFWALAGLALLASHDAVFLVQVGPGQGLARLLRTAGHDYWGTASLVLLVVAAAAMTCVAIRLALLRRAARALSHSSPPRTPGSSRIHVLAMWARLFALVAIGFMLQESFEHFRAHGHFLGPSALIGPEYPLALPVIAVITGLGALLAASVARTEVRLVAAIAAGLRRALRAPRRLARPALTLRFTPATAVPRSTAVRAPPPPLVSHT